MLVRAEEKPRIYRLRIQQPVPDHRAPEKYEHRQVTQCISQNRVTEEKAR